jgi:ubiquinone/menaquinone biosynthesis C-methylase UbiE
MMYTGIAMIIMKSVLLLPLLFSLAVRMCLGYSINEQFGYRSHFTQRPIKGAHLNALIESNTDRQQVPFALKGYRGISTDKNDLQFQQTLQRRSASLSSNDGISQKLLSMGSALLQIVLKSPLWKYLLVPMARNKIIDTAHANGIKWDQCKDWLFSQSGPWNNSTKCLNDTMRQQIEQIPEWYVTAAYHAYESGHLSWNAAIELEIASAAIGARNIPQAGAAGEQVFRAAFTEALIQAGAITSFAHSTSLVQNSIVDIGCGTGTSTRSLSQLFSSQQSNIQITGVDLSPYFIQTGIHLTELLSSYNSRTNGSTNTGIRDDFGPWICNIEPDSRIRYIWGDGTNLRPYFNDHTVDIVNIQFVFHELPVHVSCSIIKEAYRMLKSSGGQLWICEMDFDSPAYAAQRNNPFLFSLLRATEPYLDEYANGQNIIWQCLYDTFDTVTIAAATGRHYGVVATKNSFTEKKIWNDLRFNGNGQYRVNDTHLQLWEDKLTQE